MCRDCPAPCCYFTRMGGLGNGTMDRGEWVKAAEHFTYEFSAVTTELLEAKCYDGDKWVRVIIPEAEYDGVKYRYVRIRANVCSMSTADGCLIYNERPKVCRLFVCSMKHRKIDVLFA